MAVYGKKFTPKQKKMLKEYESITGFEPMHQEAFDGGEMSFSELWNLNEQFIEDIHAQIIHIPKHGDLD